MVEMTLTITWKSINQWKNVENTRHFHEIVKDNQIKLFIIFAKFSKQICKKSMKFLIQ